jgi:hypothetical protein
MAEPALHPYADFIRANLAQAVGVVQGPQPAPRLDDVTSFQATMIREDLKAQERQADAARPRLG